jgi:hypothetical protein
MTQEEKDLLLKDLCARLPYDVKVNCNDKVYNFAGIQYFNICILTDDNENNAFTTAGIKYIKPYLFPMSSMTDEQKREEYEICKEYIIGYESDLIDFYNRNHIDYRGLIAQDLAIDATGLNIY